MRKFLNVFDKLSHFFQEPPDSGETYGAIRFMYGFTSLLYLWSYYPSLTFFFGEKSICGPVPGSLFSLFQLFASSTAVVVIWWVALLNSILVLLGFRIRLALILQYLFVSSFYNSACATGNYGDDIFAPTAFLMMFLPSHHPYSLDHRFHPPEEHRTYSPWLKKTLMLFMITIYVVPMISRTQGTTWWDGTAIWYVLVDPWVSRLWAFFARNPKAFPASFFYFLTYSTVLWEVTFPLLIWFRNLRPILVLCGFLFHGALAFTMDLSVFPFQIGILLIACLDSATLKAMQASLFSSWTRRPSRQAEPG